VEGSCEYGNEPSGSIKCWEILEWMHYWRFLKKGLLISLELVMYTVMRLCVIMGARIGAPRFRSAAFERNLSIVRSLSLQDNDM
jgi:hypothetical protein